METMATKQIHLYVTFYIQSPSYIIWCIQILVDDAAVINKSSSVGTPQWQ